MKKALYIEIAGEGSMGKTFTSCTAFPMSILFDCTPRGDGMNTAMEVFGEDVFGDRYKRITHIGQAEGLVDEIIDDGKFKTVVFDEYSGLRKIAAQRYLTETKKKSVFPISDWGIINGWIQSMIWELQDNDINVVITAGFHEIYKDGDATGKKASNSPKNADLDIDFRFMLIKVVEEGKDQRIDAVVVKNKFKSIEDRAKVLPTPITWEVIKAEACYADGIGYCE